MLVLSTVFFLRSFATPAFALFGLFFLEAIIETGRYDEYVVDGKEWVWAKNEM